MKWRFLEDENSFLKKGVMASGWFQPLFFGGEKTETATNKSSHCSPPRHLDHKASVLHIVQLAPPWLLKEEFYGGMGRDGGLVVSLLLLFGRLFEICLLEKCTSWWGRRIPATFVIIVCCRQNFQVGFWGLSSFLPTNTSEYIQQNTDVFVGGMVIQVSLNPQSHCQPSPKVTEPLPSSSISWYAACRYGSTLGISQSDVWGGTFKKRPWWEKGLRSNSKGVDTGGYSYNQLYWANGQNPANQLIW